MNVDKLFKEWNNFRSDPGSTKEQALNEMKEETFNFIADYLGGEVVAGDLRFSNMFGDKLRMVKEMEAKGEYEKIMTDMSSKLETAETKAKAFDEYQASRRESLLSKLPEDDRGIYDGLPLDKLEVHVEKVNTKPSPATVDNSKPTETGGYSSFEEWATLDPKGYKKANDPTTSGKIKIGYGD